MWINNYIAFNTITIVLIYIALSLYTENTKKKKKNRALSNFDSRWNKYIFVFSYGYLEIILGYNQNSINFRNSSELRGRPFQVQSEFI